MTAKTFTEMKELAAVMHPDAIVELENGMWTITIRTEHYDAHEVEDSWRGTPAEEAYISGGLYEWVDAQSFELSARCLAEQADAYNAAVAQRQEQDEIARAAGLKPMRELDPSEHPLPREVIAKYREIYKLF